MRVSAADGQTSYVLGERFMGIGRVLSVSAAAPVASTSGIAQPALQKTLRNPGVVLKDRSHRHCLNIRCEARCNCVGSKAKSKEGEPWRTKCPWVRGLDLLRAR